MYFVNPNAGELYYLRMLLTIVKGENSFDQLKSTMIDEVEVIHRTFRLACLARGLLEHDGEWHKCLGEASVIKTGYQLRQLFGIILTRCSPSDPGVLWEKFGKYICDDIAHRLKIQYGIPKAMEEQILYYGLYLIEKIVQEAGKELKDFETMPKPKGSWSNAVGNRLIWEHRQLQFDIQESIVVSNIAKLNSAQREAYNKIKDSVDNNWGNTFFLNGIAGTGKTFMYNTVSASCRIKDEIVLTVASCGVSALLLTGGRTTYSTFKIPFEVQETSKCKVDYESKEAKLLRSTKLIIWDEVAMQNKFCIGAVDRTLRDVTKNTAAFGGITVVLGGDFRQTLPVVQRGCREQIVGASIRRSVLWNSVIILKLTQNMRLGNEDIENVEFAEFLLQVGTDPEPKIKLPQTMYRCANLSELISEIYPGIEGHNIPTTKYLTERTILSPRNEDVAAINDVILNMYKGSYRSYMAADKVAEYLEKGSSGNIGCPSESLNAMNPPSLPPFNLEVKVGSPVMFLRNIAASDGLCNGTRLRVEYCGEHVIEATILTDDKQGKLVFISRISLTPSSSDLMVRISRRQFHIRLAYAMTINKSHGQSVKFVGIDLRTPVFSHGQLYVALSRCTTA